MSTAITYPPFDGDGVSITPHRPSLDNFGGNQKFDDQKYPPSSSEPSADEWNRFAEMLALVGACMPTMMMTVDFVAGVPTIEKFWAANSALGPSDFPLVDNGAGDTTIGPWASGILPPSRIDPIVVQSENTAATTAIAELDEPARTIRVYTVNKHAGGVGVDTRFTLVYR